MLTFDQEIARSIQESLENGELKSARNWGKPLDIAPDDANAPEESRIAFKILKNAGFVPPEVEQLRTLDALRSELRATAPDHPSYKTLQAQIVDLQLRVTVRLEAMRSSKGI